jgi:putative ABC transport system permease protein
MNAPNLASGALPFSGPVLAALVSDAWENLLALRQRSVLALVGIMVGTAAVVAMLSIGQMAAEQALKPFAAMGVDLLSVQATSRGGEMQGLPLADLLALPRSIPGVVAVTGFALGQDRTAGEAHTSPTAILAARPDLARIAGLRLETGRFLTAWDGDAQVAVIGAELAHPLDRGPALAVGDQVPAGRYLYRVVGILRAIPQNALSPATFDRTIVIPLESARRSLERPDPTGALIRMAPNADEAAVAAAITRELGRNGAQIAILNARQAVAALQAQKSANTRLLAALAGISLFVGGLGVMNVMLMSMLERRQEIGLRAAIGATPRAIQVMFLAEAAVLSAAGGVLGAVLGAAVAFVAGVTAHWPFRLAAYSLPLAALVAVGVGLTFGLYPAARAARLEPVEALRAD